MNRKEGERFIIKCYFDAVEIIGTVSFITLPLVGTFGLLLDKPVKNIVLTLALWVFYALINAPLYVYWKRADNSNKEK